jgi:hypothetical protein
MKQDLVKFRLMNHKGDEIQEYTRDDAIAEFEVLAQTMTPMVMRAGGGGEGATEPVVITELGNEEDVSWLPKVAGG